MSSLKLRIPPPIVTLIAAGIIWGLDLLFPSLKYHFPGHTLIAWVLFIAGIVFGASGIGAFKRANTTLSPSQPENSSCLVTEGVFMITRNPMYFGLLLCLLGWTIFLSNPISLIGDLFFFFYMTQFQIKPEEEKLKAKFGRSYKTYKNNTHRWIGKNSA